MTLTLYTFPTPNGHKISIALELLGLPYKVETVDIKNGEQHTPEFRKVSLNGRIPALADTEGPSTGEPFALFESGAILQYLAEKYDKNHKISYPQGSEEYFRTLEWLFFQNAGVGPMQGQANHFRFAAPEKIEYGVTRYTNETKRLYGVLNTRLEKNGTGFLVGNHISIADIALVGWVQRSGPLEIDLAGDFPLLEKWLNKLLSIPEVKKGFNVPTEYANYTEAQKLL
ncbi:Disulfide-bond oxidoreductase YfcG [Yarrowia sp. C11]|nr:Disulfide-bond oxidoreductase YfcG [Yarrowia sp. C11]KAG5364017.1 Disulfide-bond oxidoreductase YfcG [Yarrowia sp. E02]